jgi:ribosomal protein L11 methylase PrmA
MEVVEAMLELAKVTKNDVVYDLGCGDGRIPVTAHLKYGCKAMGFDIDPARMRDSLNTVVSKLHGDLVVSKSKAKGDTDWDIGRIAVNNDKVVIENRDIFTLDLSKANVITLYLLPSLNVKLIPQLEKMKPGSRIVSHDFDMRGCKPDKVIRVPLKDGGEKTVYFWTIPFNKE